MTILAFKFFCVNSRLSEGLQNCKNQQHKCLHIGSTPPPPPLYTMCKKTSDLVEDGFPNLCLFPLHTRLASFGIHGFWLEWKDFDWVEKSLSFPICAGSWYVLFGMIWYGMVVIVGSMAWYGMAFYGKVCAHVSPFLPLPSTCPAS